MSFTSQHVKIRPSNCKHAQYNTKNDQHNPRVVVTINEFHLTRYVAQQNRRQKIVASFKDETTGETISDLPIRLWITPDNPFYHFLTENKSVDGFFKLTIAKSWGTNYNVTQWELIERSDVAVSPSPVIIETREQKLTRIAGQGFLRIFEKFPRFIPLVEQWQRIQFTGANGEKLEPALSPENIVEGQTIAYPLTSKHIVVLERFRKAKRSADSEERFARELRVSQVPLKVIEYLDKWLHVPLLAGLTPLRYTDATRDIVAEEKPFKNKIHYFAGKLQEFFGAIGTHFEYAVEYYDIVDKLLSEPYALCLKLHVPFKQVDALVRFEHLYSKEDLVGCLLTQRIASRLVQQLRTHPLGWTSFDVYRVGKRQLHHEMLEDLGINETIWNDQINRISTMSKQDDEYFESNLLFFDGQVALVTDVEKEETIVRILGSCSNKADDDVSFVDDLCGYSPSTSLECDDESVECDDESVECDDESTKNDKPKRTYEINELLLEKHIDLNFTSQGKHLDVDQRNALYVLLGNQVAILAGPGGSGKTSIIKTVLDYLKEEAFEANKRILQIEAVAPTGKAAVNLQNSIGIKAATCHRVVFGGNRKNVDQHEDKNPDLAKRLLTRHDILLNDLAPEQVEEHNNRACRLQARQNGKAPRASLIDVLVIDEISMLDTLIAGHLLKLVEHSVSPTYPQRIFLLGDTNQLPPVGCGQVALDLERFQRVLHIPTAKLTKIHRYGEEMTNFNQLILNHVADPTCEPMDLSSYKVTEPVDLESVDLKSFDKNDRQVISFYNMPTYAGNKKIWVNSTLALYRRIHESEIKGGKGRTMFLCTFTNEFCNLMNPLIQDAVNPLPTEMLKEQYAALAKRNFVLPKFRVGDKVFHTKNWYDPLPLLMNGMSGVVKRVDLEEEEMDVEYDGKMQIEKTPLELIRYTQDNLITYDKRMLEDHPNCITLGYCSTVHRAQGDGYDTVIYVANNPFGSCARSAYTACTRSKERLFLLTNQDIWNKQLSHPYENRKSKMEYELNKLNQL